MLEIKPGKKCDYQIFCKGNPDHRPHKAGKRNKKQKQEKRIQHLHAQCIAGDSQSQLEEHHLQGSGPDIFTQKTVRRQVAPDGIRSYIPITIIRRPENKFPIKKSKSHDNRNNNPQQSVLLKMFRNFLRTLPHPSPASDTDGKQKHDQGIDQQYDCQPSPQNTGRSQFRESTRVRNEIAVGSAGSKFRRILSTALTGHLFLLSENLKNPLRRDAILQKKITSDTNFPNCERDPALVTEIESEPAVFGIPGQQIMEFCEFARRMTDLCNPIFQ